MLQVFESVVMYRRTATFVKAERPLLMGRRKSELPIDMGRRKAEFMRRGRVSGNNEYVTGGQTKEGRREGEWRKGKWKVM